MRIYAHVGVTEEDAPRVIVDPGRPDTINLHFRSLYIALDEAGATALAEALRNGLDQVRARTAPGA